MRGKKKMLKDSVSYYYYGTLAQALEPSLKACERRLLPCFFNSRLGKIINKKIIHSAVKSSIVWLLITSCFAQVCFAEPVKVENVRFQLNGNSVVILYDFVPNGAQTQGGVTKTSNSSKTTSAGQYKVSVFLRKESDPHFSYAPTQLNGDVGVGNFVGKDRKIVWNISDEFPAGLPGKDYYFEVRAEPAITVTKDKSSSLLLWVGAGIALLGGGAATYLILSGNQSQQSGGNFPLPPGRPK